MALNPVTVKDALRDFIRQILLRDADLRLRDDDSLIDGGYLSSLAIIDLVVFVEEKFGVHIPNEEVDADRMDTLSQMTDFILEWERRGQP